jgi:pantothenate kinase
VPADDLEQLLGRVARLAQAAADDGRRRVLGIAGAPGSGKTTLVEALLAAAASDDRLTGRLAHVPMDGFHLPDAELERPEWAAVRVAIDEAWACVVPDETRLPRLVARHVAAGRPREDAEAWVSRSDEANARLVAPTLALADVVVADGRVVGAP